MPPEQTGDRPPNQDALPLGMRLGEFELRQHLGEGGFSIVYLAWDHSLERQVALKEYMPVSLAARVGGTTVRPRSEGTRETFEVGLRSFVNEARALAQFDHPALVKVHRFWEGNGTAYMVMPFYEGQTLKQTVRAMGERPDEAWLLQLLGPLTEALEVIHAARWYHRDIAPDNVVMLAGTGRPLLLDFGAARRVIGESTQALTAILKPGYAPIEQYAEVPGMKQGAWTDVYALAAVVYWAITGRTPPTAVGRMLNDTCEPLARMAAGRYSERLLRATDLALAVMPEQRTRSVGEFRLQIGLGDAPAAATPTPAMAPAAVPPGAEFARATSLPPPMTPAQPDGMTATAPGPAPRVTTENDLATIVRPSPLRATAPALDLAQRSPARRLWLVAGLGIAAAVIAGGAWLGQRAALPGALPDVRPGAPPPQSPRATDAGPGVPGPAQRSDRGEAAAVTPAPPPTTEPTSLPPPVRPAPASNGATAGPRALPTKDEAPAAAATRPSREATPTSAPPLVAPARREDVSTAHRERECAALLQRVSLGEAGPNVIERLTALGCR